MFDQSTSHTTVIRSTYAYSAGKPFSVK
jgi:hypothetical protein